MKRALALTLVCLSSASAYHLRGPDIDMHQVMSRRLGPCTDGEDFGIELVNYFYQNDCSNVLTSSFQDDVEDAADLQFQCTGPCNWKDKAFNECALTAVDQELDRIGLECMDQGSDDCNALGEGAATAIVQASSICLTSFWKSPIEDFQIVCREVAYGVCEGYIKTAADNCGASLSLTKQLELQDECEDKVDSWTQ